MFKAKTWQKVVEMADDLQTLAEVQVEVHMDYSPTLRAYTYGLSIAGERLDALKPIDLVRLLRSRLVGL